MILTNYIDKVMKELVDSQKIICSTWRRGHLVFVRLLRCCWSDNPSVFTVKIDFILTVFPLIENLYA